MFNLRDWLSWVQNINHKKLQFYCFGMDEEGLTIGRRGKKKLTILQEGWQSLYSCDESSLCAYFLK